MPLKQLNHFMRDWRKDQQRDMDPELIDLIWTLHQQLGSQEPVKLICGYRTASTNESLRRKGGGQAKASQHILGKAADIVFPDVAGEDAAQLGAHSGMGRRRLLPDLRRPLRACRHRPRAHVAAHSAARARGALPEAAKTRYLPLDGKPITPQDYKLAMAKGLPGRNTLLASVRPDAEA